MIRAFAFAFCGSDVAGRRGHARARDPRIPGGSNAHIMGGPNFSIGARTRFRGNRDIESQYGPHHSIDTPSGGFYLVLIVAGAALRHRPSRGRVSLGRRHRISAKKEWLAGRRPRRCWRGAPDLPRHMPGA